MPLYEYVCAHCGHVFERRHGMSEAPVLKCPECSGPVEQRISGGAGFIVKGGGSGGAAARGGGCSLETTGTTCCGRTARCEKPRCEN